ncbi:MAG: hypothetical protein HOY78_44555 [Saccharothrix sp.]|jgi:hypothetical protein|nr:hypothetical protein [Saccharothrix sp.]
MSGLWGIGGSISALAAVAAGLPVHVGIGLFALCAFQLFLAHRDRMAQRRTEDLKVQSAKEVRLAEVEVTRAVVGKLARVDAQWASDVLATMAPPEAPAELEPENRKKRVRKWRKGRRPDGAA